MKLQLILFVLKIYQKSTYMLNKLKDLSPI